jgi:hypothetical protein
MFVGRMLLDCLKRCLQACVAIGEQEVLLAGEVPEECSRADVGGGGDVGDRCFVVSVTFEQLDCGVDEGLVGAGALALSQ